MKNKKAEAKAYNDTIKSSMSLENKLEILYVDLIGYVENELGADKMEAIENIANIFKKIPYPWSIDDEIEVILYEYERVKAGKTGDIFLKPPYTTDIAELKLLDKYYSYFYQGLDKSLSKIIDNYSENGESLEPRVKELITKKEARGILFKQVQRSLF